MKLHWYKAIKPIEPYVEFHVTLGCVGYRSKQKGYRSNQYLGHGTFESVYGKKRMDMITPAGSVVTYKLKEAAHDK